jgi:DNA-binding IclR family transcriptional regulator
MCPPNIGAEQNERAYKKGPYADRAALLAIAGAGAINPQSLQPEHTLLGIAEIADELGMSRSTTHRYVITLVVLGFLEQDASRKYRLGPRVVDLGLVRLNSTGLRKESRTLLEELRRSTSHTAVIAILDETEIVCVDCARSYKQPESLFRLKLRPGSRLPAHCTAMGKLLLAQLPGPEFDGVVQEITFTQSTPKTITSRTALTHALREIRKQGFAVNDEEHLQDVIEVAVPVHRDTGEVAAALGLLAHPATRSVEQLVNDLRPLAESTASDLAASLHHNNTG